MCREEERVKDSFLVLARVTVRYADGTEVVLSQRRGNTFVFPRSGCVTHVRIGDGEWQPAETFFPSPVKEAGGEQ
jgi:hypothetical protein